MKAFAFVLLCALAAVQGRYTALQSTRSAAALGENPWLVHLRIAVSTSGLLKTGVGSLIGNSWVLTSAENVVNARFIWVRYGVVNVPNPTLVTENTLVRIHPDHDASAATQAYNIALISIVRHVEFQLNIAPISPAGKVADSASFCNFGGEDVPGEVLNCYVVDVAQNENGSLDVSSDEVQASAFDSGAPLVSDGAQVALLIGAGSENSVGEFLATAPFVEWIENETGLVLNSEVVPAVAPEAVHFVQ